MKMLSLVLILCLSSFQAFAACNSGGWTPAQGPQLDANGNQCVNLAASGGTQSGTVAYKTPDTYSVTTSSTKLFSAGYYASFVQLCTPLASTGNVYLNEHSAAAVVNAGTPIPAGGGCLTMSTSGPVKLPTADVYAISDSGTVVLLASGG